MTGLSVVRSRQRRYVGTTRHYERRRR